MEKFVKIQKYKIIMMRATTISSPLTTDLSTNTFNWLYFSTITIVGLTEVNKLLVYSTALHVKKEFITLRHNFHLKDCTLHKFMTYSHQRMHNLQHLSQSIYYASSCLARLSQCVEHEAVDECLSTDG
jgi:hypothetical protein